MKNLKELLEKYSKDEINLKEMIELSEKMNDEQNKEAEKILMDDWEEVMQTNEEAPKDLRMVLNKVHHRIHLQDDKRSYPLKRWWLGFQRVAAILIIPLIVGFIVLFSSQFKQVNNNGSFAEIQCPMGVRTKFILPDGTSGYLNSGSTLKFPVMFGKERVVELNGEAYFDVFYESGKPFHVKTRHLDIELKGNVINVFAKENEEMEEVVTQTGSVNITRKDGQPLAVLSANEQLIFDVKKQIATTIQVDALDHSAWKEGKLVFRNDNMQKVAQRLSRWYNADIILIDNQLTDTYNLQATFIDEPLEEVLKLISNKTTLKYKEEQRTINSDGILNRRKITIHAQQLKMGR